MGQIRLSVDNKIGADIKSSMLCQSPPSNNGHISEYSQLLNIVDIWIRNPNKKRYTRIYLNGLVESVNDNLFFC